MRKNDKAGGHRKQLSAAQRLARIKPAEAKRRFLVSWDSHEKVLRFGCGHGENAVSVCSNRKLETAYSPDGIDPRITPDCLRHFIRRSRRVEGAQLIGRCDNLLRAYLHVQDERVYSLLSAWTIGTYVYPVFSHFGYLFLYSTFPRSGKTRAEEILSQLCFEATVPLNSPTVPTIRDTAAEGHTLVLDTLERWRGKSPEAHSAAMELLDAGFRKCGTVVKMVPSTNNQWRRETFPVYAPYVLAAIDRDSVTDTALDRSFAIELHRKPIAIKKQKYNFHRCEQNCSPLRDDLYIWALDNAVRIADVYSGTALEAEVDALELNDRAADIWKPLFAIATVLGNNELRQSLKSLAAEMGGDPDSAERDRVMAIAQSLRRVVNGNAMAVGTTLELVAHLHADGLEVQDRDLHDMLVRWGFAQSSMRLGQGPRRAWELQDSKLADIAEENRDPHYPPIKM